MGGAGKVGEAEKVGVIEKMRGRWEGIRTVPVSRRVRA